MSGYPSFLSDYLTAQKEEPKNTEAALRHLLKLWIEAEEERHPEFQKKELLAKSKEALKQQRQ